MTVEIPAGKLDPGEDPLDCAKRELHEETGFRAGRIRFLTSIVTSCGFCDEIIHIYLLPSIVLVMPPQPDDDEFVNVDLVPLHELIDAVLDGKIEDAKTVVGAWPATASHTALGARSSSLRGFTKPRNESTLQTPLSGNLPFNRRSRTEVRVAPLSRHLARLGTFSLTLLEHRRYVCWDALFSARPAQPDLSRYLFFFEDCMFKRFLSYYEPQMGLFVADTVCALVLAAIDLAFPIYSA